jgi:ABC-type cobalamin/Fe3+-siderophores transport system ATPase subunit
VVTSFTCDEARSSGVAGFQRAAVLSLLAELNQCHGRTIVLVLHDINQAGRLSHHLIAMRSGRILAEGANHTRSMSRATTCGP